MFESKADGSQLRNNGGSFDVHLKPPLMIPAAAKNCTVSLITSRIWNNFPNISSVKSNNRFRYSPNNGTTWYSFTLDDGLYTVDDLHAEIVRNVIANGGTKDDIQFDPEFSTGYLNILMPAGFKIDWTNNGGHNTFRKLVGFNSAGNNVITSAGITVPIQGDSVGDFSAVSSVEVHSSFGKASKNGLSSDVLDTFPLTSKPSFLNFYQSLHPIPTDASHLVGIPGGTQHVYFRLTDQNGSELEVPDNWGVTIMLSYDL